MKYRVIEKRLTIQVEEYEIEAKSKDEALEKYCKELCGVIVPTHQYFEEFTEEFQESITVE